MKDAEGYGYIPEERGVQRLLEDFRTLSPAGIERAAWGWDRHEQGAAVERFREAEKAALRAVESVELGPTWEDLRRSVLDLTEGRSSLVSWKLEHGEVGHKAERAALGAALGLLARQRLSHDHFAALVRPMAEALPWLLPEAAPEPHRD